MGLPRFYHPRPELGKELRLSPEESRHAAFSLRLRSGDAVEVFDGYGFRLAGTLREVNARETIVELESTTLPSRPPLPLTIAMPPPQGDRLVFFVEKATELGLTAWIPLATERSVVRPSPEREKWKRLERISLAACKQCGRDSLLVLEPPLSLPELGSTRGKDAPLPLVLDPAAPLSLAEALPAGRPLLAVIGPEGGWTTAEQAFFQEARWPRVCLPGYVLRMETAALAAIACFASVLPRKEIP